ncbi:uncharacterized protein LOC127651404 [Xyrauchen texanus]|uniref:uncharacterized protein LOC127651404 n=1 Tax=Xyrauchen texanus TaxID=154827 RepID=UPI0022419618|nr:uncharacterized protein LOC127651404 [Xyrauchen texanus]
MSPDVESQSSGARSRSRCLDTFLTVSVIALFVMFIFALAVALPFAINIGSEMSALKTRDAEGQKNALGMDAPEAAYKMQNFAYLRATNSELTKGVMDWESILYGKGQSIGSMYSYDKNQRVLNVNKAGSYFMYVQLTFSCTHICPSGQFTTSIYNRDDKKQLTCTVSLPETPGMNGSAPVSRTCWHVITLPDQQSRLIAKTEFSKQTLNHWKLELNDSGFGIFLVDGAA